MDLIYFTTRVRHKRRVLKTALVKTYFHTLILASYIANERLQGEEQLYSKNYLLEIPNFRAFEKCTTKTELFNGKHFIKKLYTRL